MKTRRIVALDIGTKPAGSGIASFDTSADARRPVNANNTALRWAYIWPNGKILRHLRALSMSGATEFVFEGFSGRAGRAGNSTMASILWIGRMIGTIEASQEAREPVIVLRRDVSSFLVGARRKGDPTMDRMVADAVRVRFGGIGASDRQLKGTKKDPGPLYGVKADIWQALAAGIAYIEGCEIDRSWKQ